MPFIGSIKLGNEAGEEPFRSFIRNTAAKWHNPGHTTQLLGDIAVSTAAVWGTAPASSCWADREGEGADWVLFCGRLDLPESTLERGAAERVLHAYRIWGKECPTHLFGDYVFVVWDAARRTLFAARDPAQSHPLYYAVAEGSLLFASDPRLLLKSARISDDYDLTYLTTYVVLANLNWERTPYAAIRQIPGGHFLEAGQFGVRTGAWWKLPEPESLCYKRPEEYQDHLRDLLEKSVLARLRSDRPVTIALSRGIDSAAIAATAQRLLRSGKAPCPSVRCVSMRLSNFPEGDESGDAAEIAKHLGLPHTIVASHPHPGDITPLLGLLAEPSGLPDRYNLWKPVRDTCTEAGSGVLLTGAGGEIFTSPPYYLADLWRRRQIPAFLRELVRGSTQMPMRAVMQSLLRGLQQPSYDWTPAGRLRNYPWLRHPESCWTGLESLKLTHPVVRDAYYALVEAGQVTSALQPLFTPAGVELRNPLLDRRLAEFAYALPIGLRLRQQDESGAVFNKPLLRKAFAPELPLSLTKTNAHLRKYSGNSAARGLPAFGAQIAHPPRGLESVVHLDILRAHLTDLRQDRGEKRHLSLATVLAGWLAATESARIAPRTVPA